MIDLTLITPTADRPEAFALCERYMQRQTLWGIASIQWIVADGGETPAACTQGQEHVRVACDGSPVQNFTGNLLAALSRARGHVVAVIEDDDWYPDDYLERVRRVMLDTNADMYGEAGHQYYHVGRRCWIRRPDCKVSGLSRTATRGDRLPLLREAAEQCRLTDTCGVDGVLWSMAQERDVPSVLVDPRVVGIKGMAGKSGLTGGHRPERGQWTPDPEMAVLRDWIGDDADLYADAYQPDRVAIVSQGESALCYPTTNDYAAVIGVGSIPTVRGCDWWVSSDAEQARALGSKIIGKPRLCSREYSVLADYKPLVRDQLDIQPTAAFSGLLALSLAHWLGPARIDCYGCDMIGESDYRGQSRPADRDDGRWAAERAEWSRMVELIEGEGVEVWHVTPGGDGFYRWAERRAEVAA